MDKKEEAVYRKHNGFNCAQAVACSFCDKAGIDEETMKHATQAFGVGLGTMEGNCGAISGAAVVIGMINKEQRKTFGEIRTIMTEFKNRNTTVTCKELKGLETGKVIRECDDCIRDAVEFLEKAIED